jgi:putative nucleotidyltransferase with HDIG domain
MVSTIAVDKLRVGMYIHLDGGWLSHPFKLSAFRIADQAQLDTVRGLGLKQVRWSPDKSDLPDDTPQPAAALTPLAAQREAVQRCERQYGEAAKAWREASESVAARPETARRSSEALAQGMIDQLLVEDDVAIRLVNGSGSDRAAAHALNVSVISMLIGRALGLPAEDMLDLGVGALLHDVGKIDVPDRLRHLDTSFTAAETAGYRDHVAKGVAHGRRLGLSPGALSVLAQHHENADGSGFPQGLNAERMTAPARIVAIVNRYDNMCNPPPRVHPLTPHEAVSMLFAQGRTRFDSAVLGAFIRMMGVYPAGSLVQLTDDRYAMVVGVNSSRPLKPRVLVHDSKVPRAEALLLNLEETPDLGIRRSLAAAKLPPAALEYLDPRPRVSYYFEALVVEPHAEGALA